MTLAPLAASDSNRLGKTHTITLSVVVPVYDEESTIGECLDRLCAQIAHIHEIIVVDNNSTDRGPDTSGLWRRSFHKFGSSLSRSRDLCSRAMPE